MEWRRITLIAGIVIALFGVAWLVAGCNGDDNPLRPDVRGAVLGGSQEMPPVTTEATGTGTVQVSTDRRAIDITLVTAGTFTSTVTLAHLHVGGPGQEGPPIFTLYTQADGPFPATLSKRVTSGDLTTAPTFGINSFDDAVNAVLDGRTYLNVHTADNPDGEIRGQVGRFSLPAALSGGAVVPPVTTTAAGTANVESNSPQTQLTYIVAAQGLQNVTSIEVHFGAVDTNGPLLFTLYTPAAGVFPGSLTRTVSAFDLQAQPGGSPIASFNDVVNATLSNNTYLLIRTQANPEGELRGQFVVPAGG